MNSTIMVVMFIVGMLTWWYTLGWKKVAEMLVEKLSMTEDYFSIDILLVSLFSPYKQISASGNGIGTFQDKLREWGDKQFSRVFGAMIRLILIVIGTFWLLVQVVVDVVILAIWPLLPFLPIVGVVLMLVVGAPWKL